MDIEEFKLKQSVVMNVCYGPHKIHMCMNMVLPNSLMLEQEMGMAIIVEIQGHQSIPFGVTLQILRSDGGHVVQLVTRIVEKNLVQRVKILKYVVRVMRKRQKYVLVISVVNIEGIKTKLLMETNVCYGLPKIHMCMNMVLPNSLMLEQQMGLAIIVEILVLKSILSGVILQMLR